MRNFAEFIRSRNITDSPRGDFLADCKTLINARKFPDVQTWGDLYCFMRMRNECRPEALAEARKLWRSYQKSFTLEDITS
jgi:hypothetical protein